MTPIKYEVRVPDGNWEPFFGDYNNQRWGNWDSNSCWCLSAVNCVEDQLEWLWKNEMFSIESRQFFMKNGYIDADGDFSLSERFIEVLGGYRDNGANQMSAWELFQKHGMIPRNMLHYTIERSNSFDTKEEFNADYFNPRVITMEMRLLGQEFLKHVNISRQWIGKTWTNPDKNVLRAALKQAPVHIGVPVPWQWNLPFIQWDGTTSRADHAVELYAIDDKGQYLIFDQYEPHLKVLSADYFLPIVCQGIVNAVPAAIVNPIKQDAESNSFWTAVMNWFNDIFSLVPIGRVA